MATYAKQVDFLNVPQFDPTTNLRYQNGYVKVLLAGTSTKATVYTSRDKSTSTTNPFALDADDTKEIFLDGIFDIELYEGDPDDVDNPGVKRDTISGYEALIGNPESVVNVSLADYSAVGDGITDDTAAIQAALDDIGSGAGKLYVSGMYKITSELTSSAGYLTFVGDDPQNSGFLCTGCNWLALTQSHKYDGFRFENIAVLTDSVPTYTGLTYTGASNTGDAQQKVINNCVFGGKDRFYDLSGNTEGWLKCFDGTDGDKTTISKSIFYGAENDRVTGFPNASFAVSVDDCTHFHIEDSQIFFFDTGIYLVDQCEGVNVHRCNVVANNKGLLVDTTTVADPVPLDINIIDSHFSSYTYNINLSDAETDNSLFNNIRGCLFFKRADSTVSGFKSIITRAVRMQITDNFFYWAASLNTVTSGDTAIDIQGGENVLICGNYFNNIGECLKVASTVRNVGVYGNMTFETNAETQSVDPVTDGGATRLTFGNNTADTRIPSVTQVWSSKSCLTVARYGAVGNHSFYNDDVEVFRVTNIVGTPANGIQVVPAEAGSPPFLFVFGTDTDIDLRLAAKGSGKVRFGQHAAIGAETVTGYITIKDSNGTERKIAVVS